jgi:hypothetical protein
MNQEKVVNMQVVVENGKSFEWCGGGSYDEKFFAARFIVSKNNVFKQAIRFGDLKDQEILHQVLVPIEKDDKLIVIECTLPLPKNQDELVIRDGGDLVSQTYDVLEVSGDTAKIQRNPSIIITDEIIKHIKESIHSSVENGKYFSI